jgi:hypothetical protein
VYIETFHVVLIYNTMMEQVTAHFPSDRMNKKRNVTELFASNEVENVSELFPSYEEYE